VPFSPAPQWLTAVLDDGVRVGWGTVVLGG